MKKVFPGDGIETQQIEKGDRDSERGRWGLCLESLSEAVLMAYSRRPKMTTKESLALAVSELIRRMSAEEKIELMRCISWEELEGWKATAEVLSDEELMQNLRQGLQEEAEGKVTGVGF